MKSTCMMTSCLAVVVVLEQISLLTQIISVCTTPWNWIQVFPGKKLPGFLCC